MQGASEALRGALNSSLERHTGGDPAVIAAHDDVAAKGRREIESGRFYREPGSGTSPASPAAIRGANNPSVSVAPASGYPGGPAAGVGMGREGFGGGAGPAATLNPRMQADGVQSLNGTQHAQALGGPVGSSGEEGNGRVKRKGLKNVLRKGKDGLN